MTVPSTACTASMASTCCHEPSPSVRNSTRMIVSSTANGSLLPDSTSRVAPTRGRSRNPRGVHQEEHRRGVGRGHHRADQQRLGPAHVEQVFGDRGGDRRREQDTDGRERGRRRQHAAKGGKPRAQAAVEQDQRQRDRADHVGRAHVVELDAARPPFAREHPDDQEHEQQRRAEAHRHQARHDAGQDQESAQQNADADGVERGHDPRILDPHWKCALAARQLLISSFGVIDTPRHGRARPGHPRHWSRRSVKTWMPGTSPGMTSPV